jgi:hypothetical protein
VLNIDGSATVRATISSTSAKIRFNVTSAQDLLRQGPGSDAGAVEFAMRFRDNGPDARVIATLKQVGLYGFYDSAQHTTEVLATIDSDWYHASDQWHTGRPAIGSWRRIVNELGLSPLRLRRRGADDQGQRGRQSRSDGCAAVS